MKVAKADCRQKTNEYKTLYKFRDVKLDRFRLGSNKDYSKLGNSTISFYSKRPLAARLEKALPLAMATSKYIVDWQKSCRLKAISEFTFKCKELSDISLEITFQKRAILLPALRKGMPNCGIRGNNRLKYNRWKDIQVFEESCRSGRHDSLQASHWMLGHGLARISLFKSQGAES